MAVGAALWILIDPHSLFASRGDGHLHVTFIDVGQGDAAFIVFPLGSTLLVDAGGLGFSSSFDVGERVVAPVIRAIGFRRVGRVALTHGDPDHIGGALSIIREFRPREIWEGIPVPRLDALAALRTEAKDIGARWSNVHAGDCVTVDGVLVSALHPEREDWERQKVRNDDSLVLELRWQDVSVLLTGDAGRIPEQRILSALAPARLRVVKVPHHGSLTSSSPGFVERTKPSIAVVSVGRNNHFGHPVPEVLARYTSAGAQVYRTDRDGAVSIETDGWSMSVHTNVDSNTEGQ
jgi:competence protein ComEC